MGKLLDIHEKGLGKEILRFIATGIIATVVDFIITYVVASFLPTTMGVWKEVVYTACGFIVSLVINYFLSAFWVYKNVDEKINTKSFGNVVLFVALSCVGLALGIGIMIGFNALDQAVIHSNFELWLDFIFKGTKFSFKAFAFAILFFGVKTLIVLAWNYLSRKKLIFKSKNESSPN